MRVHARVAILACAACGATPPPAASGASAGSSAPTVSPEPVAVAEPAASPAATAIAPLDAGVSPDAPAAAAPVVAIAPSCRGAALDLRALVKRGSCAVDAPARKLPDAIAVSVAPATVEVRAGHVVHATLVLTNTSDADATLLLDDGCGHLTEVIAVMRDASGARVDVAGNACSHIAACGVQTVGIALPPRGTASLPFDVDGRKERYDDECRRVGRVAPGSYDLDVFGVGTEVHAAVRVR